MINSGKGIKLSQLRRWWENEDDDEEDYESESISDIEENEKENRNDANERKRKHEVCNLEDYNENPMKKKDKPTMRWLPNGNKASN